MSYLIGYIKNTQGLKGNVIVGVNTDFDRFQVGKIIYFYENEKKVKLTIKNTYETKKGLVVTFVGYDDINSVNNFKGKELYTDEEPILEDDEFHQDEIIGKEVYNQNNLLIGVVSGIMDVPQGYILRIQTKDKVALVPFDDYFIISVSDNKITINEIEGLI